MSADGKLFATGSWDGALKIWSTNEENIVKKEDSAKQPAEKKKASSHDPPQDKVNIVLSIN